MAYGKRRRGYGRKRTSYSRKKTMVPVPKKKKTTRSYARSNALAVNRNTKLLQELKMSQYGSVQKNFQASRGTCNPVNGRPVLLDLSDFSKGDPTTSPPTMGGYWYQKDVSGTLQQVNMWTEPPAFFGQNPFWQNVNKDIPNSGKIFECWQKITFKFEGNLRLTDTRIRIDLFRAKAKAFTPNAGVTPTLILPGSLGAFGGLAECQNKISSTYFSKVMTRWVYMNSSRPDANVGTVQGTTGNSRFVSIYTKLNRVRTQSLTTPIGTAQSGAPEPQEGAWGPLQSSIQAPLWCLISASDPLQGDVQDVICSATRTVCWRDPQGMANIF